ncbi:hypothetical protein LIPSTDRAFT_262866 [Lipomyces starkeyi NRRL Y-11557]|uniref:Uncharacterized protein n=1 Tax=Lipomyces starkeyi NRRL Y-11557 TaxID=675824 RepID=A0A1E3Q727_LIPST|nr:hypothetical protein LIPSTDRAFT_262866 [Lipomyces starkeyi NRRL Y-11557]
MNGRTCILLIIVCALVVSCSLFMKFLALDYNTCIQNMNAKYTALTSQQSLKF